MFPAVTFAAAPESGFTKGILGILAAHKDRGISNVVIVVGSDRIPEFQAKVAKYNGTLYKFDTISVVSAGERDPDDDSSTAGMSGTKMRAAAKSLDFAKFRSGIPKSLSDSDTKELMMKLKKVLSESVEEKSPANYKALFLIGGAGSGKDMVLSKALSGHGLQEVNMSSYSYDLVKSRAGLIINTSAASFENIKELKENIERLGYDTHALFVTVSNEASKRRNTERSEIGKRSISEETRFAKWSESNSNREKVKELFGENHYTEFDNSLDLRSANLLQKSAKSQELQQLKEMVREFVQMKNTNNNSSSNDFINEEFEKAFVESLAHEPVINNALMYSSYKEYEVKGKKKKKKKIYSQKLSTIPVVMMRQRERKKD
jgi:hypothetical protein